MGSARAFSFPVVSLTLLAILLWTPADGAAQQETEEARLRLRDQLRFSARVAKGFGNLDVAVETAGKVLAIEREIFGEEDEEVAATLAWIATLEEARGGFAAARARLEEALRVRVGLSGDRDWRVTDARLAIADLGLRERLSPGERKLLEEATALSATVVRLDRDGEQRRAIPTAERALAIRRRTLGEKHPDTATALANLAALYESIGEYGKAEPLLVSARRIMREALGEEHPRYARSLNDLAYLHDSRGEYTAAEPLYLQALRIRKAALGERHPDTATSLNNLAVLYKSLGRYAKAEPLYRRAMEIDRELRGEEHPLFARTVSNLALLYETVGEYARAKPLLQQALEIRRKTLGEEHPDTAASLGNLAVLYVTMGEHEKAEPLLEKALDLKGKALGEEHPSYAVNLQNLAALYASMGRYDEAEPLFLRALDINRRSRGADHPACAATIYSLGSLHQARGDFSAAAPLLVQSLEIRRKALGEEHPHVATSLSSLATLYGLMGEFALAEPLHRQAVSIDRKVLNATFAVQSEGEQLRMSRKFRGTLDAYLSLAAVHDVNTTAAYASVLAWKGAVYARQVRARIPREDPEIADLFAKLARVSRDLATLSLSTPGRVPRETFRRRLGELGEEREELERELSRRSQVYREVREAERLSPSRLQAALPPGVALLDFLEYEGGARTADGVRADREGERRMIAYVVPPKGEIHQVDLGFAAPIAKAVDEWRSAVPRGKTARPGSTLRRLVWEPLAKHLAGVKTVLVSPDGALNRLPFPALPGEKPDTYLIEEVSIAVLPVPQLLPALAARPRPEETAAGLLLVGDVDYGGALRRPTKRQASRTAPGTRAGARRAFVQLPATRGEIEAIGDSFARRHEDAGVSVLAGSEATEAAFRTEAPKHRWLHLATHGFFAPPGLHSALEGGSGGGSGYHPGLLSGLALSGADTQPEPDEDDGILTALEVASLDLSAVKLAVLSACDTGLGEVAGGEGVLGLQRAFQVAGARTTVTSLWSVSDRATRRLMERFYRNLWEKKLPGIQALREAQLWLLREGARTGDLRRDLGLPETDEARDESGRLSPHLWAGFVLSGDWR